MALTPDELSGHALGLHSAGMLTMQGVAAALAGSRGPTHLSRGGDDGDGRGVDGVTLSLMAAGGARSGRGGSAGRGRQ